MIDQYFGIKELYEISLKAKNSMQFGSRYIQEGEPVLYFEKVNFSMLSEKSSPIMARGGWANLPRVIWEDRSEVSFVLTEGVMSSISMGILLSANVVDQKQREPLYIPKKEGPLEPKLSDGKTIIYIQNAPILPPNKKVFIFEYSRKIAQKMIYGQILNNNDPLGRICIAIYQDKDHQIPADINKQYIVDYYYEYKDKALIYEVQKERFNGLFTLEGKFYSKDENEGKNYTNLIYMPKVRVVSDIGLRLGERADPTVSTFNIIGLPENAGNNRQNLILEITRLNEDIDGVI